MPKKTLMEKPALAGYDDIFRSTVNIEAVNVNTEYMASETTHDNNTPEAIQSGERIVDIPLSELYPPDFHPFNVSDDETMDRLARNVKQYGVRVPGLVRPRKNDDGEPIGGYELTAGNRRKRACELAELPSMPVIIRDMDDNDAIIAMVDSNLENREKLLHSEKAWAYRVKMEALNHNGVKGDKHSHEILMEQTGESKNAIFRLIRLTELVVGLLDKVDKKQLAFNPAVELSYLSQAEQAAVEAAMDNHETKPSLSQAIRLKKLSQAGELTQGMIGEILSEVKKAPNEDKEDRGDKDDKDDSEDREYKGLSQFRDYFPDGFTFIQMSEIITGLLKKWQVTSDTGLGIDGIAS